MPPRVELAAPDADAEPLERLLAAVRIGVARDRA